MKHTTGSAALETVRTVCRMSAALAGILLTLTVAFADDRQPVPSLTERVTDLTNTLDANQTQILESELAALEKRKGSQIGVLIVATTQPEDISQYATRVFDAWKLGRKSIDDGVLLIVAKNDKRVRIEVARGLEGAIPDAAAARVIREYLMPRFRSGDFYGGIEAATGVLTRLIDGEPLPAPIEKGSINPIVGVFGFFLAFLLRGLLGARKLLIRAPLMVAFYGITSWGLTQWVGESLTYSLVVAAVWSFFALLVSLIPSFFDGVNAANRGHSAVDTQSSFDEGGSQNSSSSNSSDSSSSSDSGGSFSGGGGESAGGGASGSW